MIDGNQRNHLSDADCGSQRSASDLVCLGGSVGGSSSRMARRGNDPRQRD